MKFNCCLLLFSTFSLVYSNPTSHILKSTDLNIELSYAICPPMTFLMVLIMCVAIYIKYAWNYIIHEHIKIEHLPVYQDENYSIPIDNNK